MNRYNKVALYGSLKEHPELVITRTDQLPIAYFTLIVERNPNEKRDASPAEIPCVCTRNTAIRLSRSCRKGTIISLAGEIRNRKNTSGGGIYVYVDMFAVAEINNRPEPANDLLESAEG